MNQLTIEICNNRVEADARKKILKKLIPGLKSRIVENIDFVSSFLVPNIENEPDELPDVFTPATGSPSSPAVVLLVWTED